MDKTPELEVGNPFNLEMQGCGQKRSFWLDLGITSLFQNCRR
jgi:hypothetical protein